MTVMRIYKYKIYRSKRNKNLDRAIDLAAEIWNHCIALHKRYYSLFGKHLSANKLKMHIAKLKKQLRYSHWSGLGSQAVQDVVERIDRSYKAFFEHHKQNRRGRKSPPGFKKRRKYSSFTLKQAGYSFAEDTNEVVIMGRRYKYHKSRDLDGVIKTVTIKRSRMGEFFVYVVCKQEVHQTMSRTGNAVGLDFGLKAFLTADDGKMISSPEWYKAALKDLRKVHRELSHKKRGSKNRRRALMKLERVYERISNQRRDWFFKLAWEICAHNAFICNEDINLDGMKRMWGRKVSDLAFAEFVSILEWVAFKAGATVVKIDRWAPSSKACHVCGTVNPALTLKDREWTCDCCGSHLDRDVNAAINIRQLGLAQLGISA